MKYISLLLSVFLGIILVLTIRPKFKIVKIFLAFSGAYLLSMTILHLMPLVFESKINNIGLFVLLGVVLQIILEFFSRGIEHGHAHFKDDIKTVPWSLLISLFLHAFIEGIPLYGHGNEGLLVAIIIHKMPVTIILVTFLLNTELPKTSILSILLAFAVMTPLGAFAPSQFDFFRDYYVYFTAIIIGVLLHIATAILFESSHNHKFNIKKFAVILLGFLIGYAGTFIGH